MQLFFVNLWLYVKLILSFCTCIVCKIDRLDLLADVPLFVVHLAEFCKECHLHGALLFPGPLGQGGISCAWTRFSCMLPYRFDDRRIICILMIVNKWP